MQSKFTLDVSRPLVLHFFNMGETIQPILTMRVPDQIDFDKVVKAYQESLFTVLRGFRPTPAYLETWVHDEDPVKSVLNMIEAAEGVGQPDVRIYVGAETVKKMELSRLSKLAARTGRLQIDARAEGGVDIHVTFSSNGTARGTTIEDRAAEVKQAWERRQKEYVAHVYDPAEKTSKATSDAIHPVYLEAIQSLATDVTHEGNLIPDRGHLIEVRREGMGLSVEVDADHRVRSARHLGGKTPLWRGLLEGLCRILEGNDIQECSDHALIRLENRLRDRSRPRPVSGIVTPKNADPALSLLEEMVHELFQKYRRMTGKAVAENTFDPEPSAEWLALSDKERLARIQQVLDESCEALGLPPSSAVCVQLQRDVRVIVDFSEQIGRWEKTGLMMKLESAAKRKLERKLHFYIEEMKDKNKIRRL